MFEPVITTHWDPSHHTITNADLAAAVALVRVPGSHGTGWLVSPTHVVTNHHVVAGAEASQVYVLLPDDEIRVGTKIDADLYTDLAVIHVESCAPRHPMAIDVDEPTIGTEVCTWGHPTPYAGPSPLLIFGHLAGFSRHQIPGARAQRRLVLNAAINPGNSGGPVMAAGQAAVRGVIATKALYLPPHLQAAINAMHAQMGITTRYPVPMPDGTTRIMIEGQIVAECLEHFRKMTQMVLGEAIMASDLVAFLDQNGIPWTPA
ncbi:S1 family peptidase [Sorangium sp. So ce1389]|uniref:S1 family peptidase n=1 Tax=Sorangium sp. So ce1389 TaxID=3133336 RepID=UPI003F64614B